MLILPRSYQKCHTEIFYFRYTIFCLLIFFVIFLYNFGPLVQNFMSIFGNDTENSKHDNRFWEALEHRPLRQLLCRDFDEVFYLQLLNLLTYYRCSVVWSCWVNVGIDYHHIITQLESPNSDLAPIWTKQSGFSCGSDLIWRWRRSCFPWCGFCVLLRNWWFTVHYNVIRLSLSIISIISVTSIFKSLFTIFLHLLLPIIIIFATDIDRL